MDKKLKELENLPNTTKAQELRKLVKKEKNEDTRRVLAHKLKYIEEEIHEEKFVRFLDQKQKKRGKKAGPLTPEEISALKDEFKAT